MGSIPWAVWAMLVVVLGYLWIAARVRLGIARRRLAGGSLVIGNNLQIAWITRGFVIAFVFTVAAMIWLDLGLGWAWLIAINLATMAVFWWDKVKGVVAGKRVPENTLHTLAAVGGSTGLLVGIDVFRHKKSDEERKFRQRLWNIILLQAVFVALIARQLAG